MMGKNRTGIMTWITTSPISLTPIIFFVFLLIPISIHAIKDESLGTMRVELVHRLDPRIIGPERPNLDRFERIKELAHRDMARRHNQRRKNLETVDMKMHAGRDYGSGEYFVEVRVGTPSQRFWLIADTGSDLTWVNCNYNYDNDHHHHHRNSTARRVHKDRSSSRLKHRVFSAHHSSTFQTVPCSSKKCKDDLAELFSLQACPNPSDPCLYDFRYADGSAAKGLFAVETITVRLSNGKHERLKNLLVGCTKSTTNAQTLNKFTDGLLGLGLSKESFVNNVASEFGGKFSYCLVDHLSHRNISNFLTFGTTLTPNTKLLSPIHRTPLVIVPPLYGLNVVGLSIGDEMLKIPSKVWDFKSNGGLILDSGTTLTFLAMPAYEIVVEVLVKSLKNEEKIKAFESFDHCYSSKGFNESLVPRLVFHFAGGARFDPPVKSYVIDVGPQEKCIGILGAEWPGISTMGNIMQQNHHWEFDLTHNIVGFAPSSCH